MMGSEAWSSGVASNCSANGATISDTSSLLVLRIMFLSISVDYGSIIFKKLKVTQGTLVRNRSIKITQPRVPRRRCGQREGGFVVRDVSRGQGRSGTRTGGPTRVDNVAVDRVERVRRWSENEVTLEQDFAVVWRHAKTGYKRYILG